MRKAAHPLCPRPFWATLTFHMMFMPSPFTAFADAPKVLPGLGVKVEGAGRQGQPIRLRWPAQVACHLLWGPRQLFELLLK